MINLKSGSYLLSDLKKLMESPPKSTTLESLDEISLYQNFYEGVKLIEENLRITEESFVNIFHTPLYELGDVLYFNDDRGRKWLRTNDSWAIFFDGAGVPRHYLPIILISDGLIITTISPLYYIKISEIPIIPFKYLLEVISRKENLVIDIEKGKIIYYDDIIEKYS